MTEEQIYFLLKHNRKMFYALNEAARIFGIYEHIHRDKRTPEGDTKARTNKAHKEMCERACDFEFVSRNELKIIERKIAAFSMVEIIKKAKEEAKELYDELDNMLECSPEIALDVLKKVAKEFADVEIAVHDTLIVMPEFREAYEAKREFVYNIHLPEQIAKKEGKV